MCKPAALDLDARVSNYYWLADAEIYALRCQNLAPKWLIFPYRIEYFGQMYGSSVFSFIPQGPLSDGWCCLFPRQRVQVLHKTVQILRLEVKAVKLTKSPSAKYIHIKAMITQREMYKNRPWAACSHTTSGTHCRTALDCCYLILVVSDIRRF